VSSGLIARGVALAVVDLFEPVVVDAGEHEVPVSAPSAADLALEHDDSKLATEGSGELINLRAPQLGSRLRTIVRRGDAICRGLLAVGSGLVSAKGPLRGIDFRAVAIGCCVIAIGGGLVRVRHGAWVCITARSSPVNGPPLSRIESGTAIFPMSCIVAADSMSAARFRFHPRTIAICPHSQGIRTMRWPSASSRNSTARSRRLIT
jgi:hypothetical protein